jgi:putative endonuclease
MKRQSAERGGRRAESLAAWWLRLKGWRILARRVRTPVGEIDLVARRGRTIAFVEVKARATAVQADLARD